MAGETTALTSAWSIDGTALRREVSCPSRRTTRFDVAPAEGGFQVLVPANDGRTTGLTYRRIGG